MTETARQRLLSLPWDPLFIADWERVLMIHYEVDAPALQVVVPFDLDLWDGRAFVSVVPFTMRGMRPRFGGPVAAWLLKPIATHPFLNVRTYVRYGSEAGIYFLAEWLSNRLSVAIGPRAFGLPYRFGRIGYNYNDAGELSGRVEEDAGGGALVFRAKLDLTQGFCGCEPGSLCDWLMERYTAFTHARGKGRFFRVWHRPWMQVPAELEVSEQSLLETNWDFFRDARIVGANFSPGAFGVWMGRPHRV